MDPLNKNISKNLKMLRQGRGLSLDGLAQVTGVSKAMLGQIERGESSPTISTLWKIATGLQMPFSMLLDKPSTTKTKPTHFISSEANIIIDIKFPYDSSLAYEIFYIKLFPHYTHYASPHEKGVSEHILAHTGEVEIFIEGNWRILKSGEGLQFDAHNQHRYRNSSKEIVSFYDIIHYPR
jgi:transcriptional regulator with XRE-family HTH domain